MYSTHAWKVDNISIQIMHHWKCLFIDKDTVRLARR